VLVHPELLEEVKKYGAFDISACFNCGNCTAVCPLSKVDASFPRRLIRCGQTGMEETIHSAVEPWQCYYCGECSLTCPRQASPGEYMMALRRYLIAKYDVTGVSTIFFKNRWLQIFLTVGLFAALLVAFNGYGGDFGVLAARLEMAFPVYVTLVLGGYVFNMYRHVILRPLGKLAFSAKPKHIAEAFYHGLTQINFTRCEETDWWRWISHWLVMSGYVLTLLISNLHLLEPLNRHYTPFGSVSLLVWYAGLSIVIGGGSMSLRRVFQSAESSKFSHPSDWLFVMMLFLIGISMLATHFANVAYGPEDPLLNALYRINIAIETAWIIIVVPFSKWIHIFFRPLAVYFQHTKREVEAGTAFTIGCGQTRPDSHA
jgi:ferredoxin